MSAKRSRALSRLENHNVSPVRTQNERSGNESQRKSKSAETCSRPRSEDNVPISHHHSKRSRERSPSKKRSRSRSRERSPSKKRSRSRSSSSRRKRSRTQSPRPGPSKDLAIPFHRKVGRRRVHVDVHIAIVKLHLSGQGFWFRPSRPAMKGCLCWNQR